MRGRNGVFWPVPWLPFPEIRSLGVSIGGCQWCICPGGSCQGKSVPRSQRLGVRPGRTIVGRWAWVGMGGQVWAWVGKCGQNEKEEEKKVKDACALDPGLA